MLTEDPLFRGNNRVSLNVYTIQQTVNLYAYAINNPIRFVDPWGLAVGDVLMPDGTTAKGIITNGITHIDGKRPPIGAIVETSNGFYMMTESGGKKVLEASYSCPDEAAYMVGMIIHGRSTNESQEYGALIVQNSKGGYSITNITNSWEHAQIHNISITFNSRNNLTINRTTIPTGTTAYATIHTHWRSGGSLNFSEADYQSELLNRMYLVNRYGYIMYSERPGPFIYPANTFNPFAENPHTQYVVDIYRGFHPGRQLNMHTVQWATR